MQEERGDAEEDDRQASSRACAAARSSARRAWPTAGRRARRRRARRRARGWRRRGRSSPRSSAPTASWMRDVVEAADEPGRLGQGVAVHPRDPEVPGSGRPVRGSDAQTNSGETAMPTTLSLARRPLMTAVTREPGHELPASPRTPRSSDDLVGAPRLDLPARTGSASGSAARPLATSARRSARRRARRCPPSPSRKSPTTRPSTAATPGSSRRRSSTGRGARFRCDEDVGEAGVRVEGVPRGLHRGRGGDGSDEARDAAADERARS